jgi:hypothetical protein
MSRKKIGLHEVVYERLSEAEKRQPHAPRQMRSGNSKGPIHMWVCNELWCEAVEYTYTEPHTPPVCFGGMRWSYRTNDNFDVRVHQPWAEKEF